MLNIALGKNCKGQNP